MKISGTSINLLVARNCFVMLTAVSLTGLLKGRIVTLPKCPDKLLLSPCAEVLSAFFEVGILLGTHHRALEQVILKV